MSELSVTHLTKKMEDKDKHERQHYESGGSQIFADAHEDDKCTDYLDQRDDDILGSVMKELRDLEQVVRYPAHQLTGLLVIVEREWQFLQMRKDLCAHVVFHLRAHNVTYIGYVIIREELDNDEADQYEP